MVSRLLIALVHTCHVTTVVTSDWCRCSTAVFLDYYLMTLHPLLILALCVILYTRSALTDTNVL